MRSAAMPLSRDVFHQSSAICVEHDSPVVKPTLLGEFCLALPSIQAFPSQGVCKVCVLPVCSGVCIHHMLFFSLLIPHFLFLPCLLHPLESPATCPLLYCDISL